MPVLKNRIRPILLLFLGAAIVTQIVILSPSHLEDREKPSQNRQIDPSKLLKNQGPSLAPGIPKDLIPEYTVENFRYVAVQNTTKLWQIHAEIAFLYQPGNLVHARNVKVLLFDSEEKATVVTGKEAKYYLNNKDLEMFGDVHTAFTDGFEMKSEYMRYRPNEQHISIPESYFVEGSNHKNQAPAPTPTPTPISTSKTQAIDSSPQTLLKFESYGLDYKMKESLIKLQKKAKVTFEKTGVSTQDRTVIESDVCDIDRNKSIAKFTMDPKRPLKTRFVHMTQPELYARSRTANLSYGDFNQALKYLVAVGEVLIKETGKPQPLRYATAGRAEFDNQHSTIVLTEYPQVYQDQDTITGDIVIIHRDTDVVEVEHSNAYSEGSSK